MTIDLEQFKGHTPGPWVAGTWLKTWDVEGPNGEEIAYFNDNIGVGNPQTLPAGANAQLAAAAPALLSEVRRLKEEIEKAYGLLWHMSIDTHTRSGFAASEARKALLSVMDKASQARGITEAKLILGEPSWARCPSTHCERRQECASPSECIVGERARSALSSSPVEKEKT